MNHSLNTLPGYLLRRVSAALYDEFSELLQDIGFRPAEASVLFLIEANPEITPSALGKLLGIQRANMVPIIARLEKKGLTRRVKLDGRSYGMCFTDKGREAYAKIHGIINEHEENILSRIPERSRKHFAIALQALWSAESEH